MDSNINAILAMFFVFAAIAVGGLIMRYNETHGKGNHDANK